MGKPTSFKNFMSVDNNPGEDELTKYRKQRRKRSDTEEAYENTMYCKKCGCERGDADPDCSCDMNNATLKDSQCYSEQSKCGSLRNEAFEPHMMYDPKTGKGYKADKEEDHIRMKKMGYTHSDPSSKNVKEALTIQQRLQRSRNMKKKRAVIAMGRKRAMRKMAPKDKLVRRARRAARNEIVKKLTKGVPKSELNNARKREIERRVDKMKPRVDRLARKMFPQVRKKEVARKKR